MATPTVYVICDQNCKFEGMTKEQIYTAIVQAVNEGTIGDIDTGFISTIKTITGSTLKFFVGTQAEYDVLTDEQKLNLFAVISNDETLSGIDEAIKALQEKSTSLETQVDALRTFSLVKSIAIDEYGRGTLPKDDAILLKNSLCLVLYQNNANAFTGTLFIDDKVDLTQYPMGSYCYMGVVGAWSISYYAHQASNNITINSIATQNTPAGVTGTLSFYKIGGI